MEAEFLASCGLFVIVKICHFQVFWISPTIISYSCVKQYHSQIFYFRVHLNENYEEYV